MAWCPWRGNTIATGGGWKDGKLRIWDTNAGTCVTAVTTDSQVCVSCLLSYSPHRHIRLTSTVFQICSLQWAEQKRHVVTGHGLPHHQVTCWTWESDSLRPVQQFKGQRISRRPNHFGVENQYILIQIYIRRSFTSSPSLGHESRP